MIIDAHTHAYLCPRIRYAPGRTSFLSAAEQIDIMDRERIDQAVLLPCSNAESSPEVQGVDEILRICEQYPGRFIPFCYVDPRLTGSLYTSDVGYFVFVLRQYQQLGCCGLGELTCKVWWDAPEVWALIEACEIVGFPITFHTSLVGTTDYGLIDEIGLPRLEKTLRRFPNVTFLAHSMGFWSEISSDVRPEDKTAYPSGPVRPGGAVVRLMREYPNLYGDLSANSGLNALRRDPDVGWRFVDEFQDRLVFGTDRCSPYDDRQHLVWLAESRDAGGISRDAYDKIVGRNMATLLNLTVVSDH
jgi:predicted TIM-barrel fold metal-dependent hydrolase